MHTIKIIFYKRGDYTPLHITYQIPEATYQRLRHEYTDYMTSRATFRALFAPVLRKLHATDVSAYIER